MTLNMLAFGLPVPLSTRAFAATALPPTASRCPGTSPTTAPPRRSHIPHIHPSARLPYPPGGPGGPEPPRDNFVPALVIIAAVGYTLIIGYDFLHSWGII